MIKANELRLGNLVMTKFGKVKIIDAIHGDGTDNYRYPGSRGIEFIETTDIKCSSDYKPIPLTEEWLLKFGFEKYEITGSYIKTPKDTAKGFGFRFHTQHPFTEDLFNSVVECSYMEQQLYVKNGLKYVHQLQNLYFALTGNELNIKL